MEIGVCTKEEIWHKTCKTSIQKFFKVKNRNQITVHWFDSVANWLNNNCRIDVMIIGESFAKNNCIEFAKSIRSKDEKVKIIFITDQFEVAKEAFRVEAYRVIEKRRFMKEMNICLREIYQELYNEYLFAADYMGSHVSVEQNQIMYIMAVKNGTMITLKNQESVFSKYSLKESLKHLDAKKFFRCHRSIIVNLSFIDWIDEKVYFTNGLAVSYSRRNKKELVEAFANINL